MFRLRVASVEKLKGDLRVFPIVFDAGHVEPKPAALIQGCQGFFKADLRLLFKAQLQGFKAARVKVKASKAKFRSRT